MDAVETVEFEHGIKGKLFYDEDVENPRKNYDHLGTMLHVHPRYDLGDEQVADEDAAIAYMLNSVSGKIPLCESCREPMEESYSGWVHEDEDSECEHDKPDTSDFYVMPLYLYDHSGLTMRTTAFSCPWDSGQVGIIFIHKDVVLANWTDVEDWEDKARGCLQTEVEEFDQYLTGDVYGYVIEDEDGESLDSCWGFFGNEYALDEMKSAAKHYVEEAGKEKADISERLANL